MAIRALTVGLPRLLVIAGNACEGASQGFGKTHRTGCDELFLLDLKEFGFDIELFTSAFGVINEFIHSQYVYRGLDSIISPKEGDTVLDCGACFGGTTLFFAQAVGAQGKVLSFEFSPDNVEIFRRNLSLNSTLAERVEIVQAPVGESSGNRFLVGGVGPATYLVEDQGRIIRRGKRKILLYILPRYRKYRNMVAVETLSIDDFVKRNGIDRVDYIKMDIEGAELEALKGAKSVIERDKPTLAICVYHRLKDFHTIPRYIDGLALGYEFALQHGTLHNDETVLFAEA